jgi:GntR family transcriptional regulator
MASMPGRGLNRVGGHPLHRQVADRLRAEILDGTRAPGDRLPSERELVELFGAERMTIRKAIAQLRAEGWVETVQGAGTRVREQPPRTALQMLLEVDQDHGGPPLMYRHHPPWGLLQPTRIAREAASAEVARRLEVDPGTRVIVRDRVIGPEDGPVTQLATTYLPAALTRQVPGLDRKDTGPAGYLGLLEQAGIQLRFTLTVAARMPLPAEAAAFQLGPGQPVIQLLRVSYDAATDQPVELTDYRLDAARYEVAVALPDRRGPLGGTPDPGPKPGPSDEELEPAHEADLDD